MNKKYIVILTILLIVTSCNSQKSTDYSTEITITNYKNENINVLIQRITTYYDYLNILTSIETNDNNILIKFNDLIQEDKLRYLLKQNGIISLKGDKEKIIIDEETEVSLNYYDKKMEIADGMSLNLKFKDNSILETFTKKNLNKKIDFMIGKSSIASFTVTSVIQGNGIGIHVGYPKNDAVILASIIQNQYEYSNNELQFSNNLFFKDKIINNQILEQYNQIKSEKTLLQNITNIMARKQQEHINRDLSKAPTEVYPKRVKEVYSILNFIKNKKFYKFIKFYNFKTYSNLEKFLNTLNSEVFYFSKKTINNPRTNSDFSKNNKTLDKTLDNIYSLLENYKLIEK